VFTTRGKKGPLTTTGDLYACESQTNFDTIINRQHHWVTVIICMKFKEVWYLDSAKQHPPLKFLDLQNVLNWSVSCRFCSQKFNLLVFLIGIADHAGPLVQYFFHKKVISYCF
jgi:hypothetical protein